ncbi:uncharacterized protein LOC126558915 [Anopheles maculipalpis]|uniref:uncharacterized protein LOC126558915 n=1 Tax=Anopheles maculipalpis TaxID=1496333 RepID=UPI0021594346|nr:uncharacterized protein LOC126558915 [Anopheles maculipalpis]
MELLLSPWKLTWLCGLVCLLVPAVVQCTFLDTYQGQLAELHKQMKTEIGKRFRENSELNGAMIERDLIPLLAEGTVAIREANSDLQDLIAFLRPSDATGECWASVDALIYLYKIFSQWDLQDCAYAGYARWMREDGRVRFYPVAHELHRASSEVINAIVGVLSEDNVITNGEEVEGRLDANLDHFNEVSIEGLQDLDEELEKHNDRRDAIEQFMRQCIDRTIATSREDVDYTVRYAEDFCL